MAITLHDVLVTAAEEYGAQSEPLCAETIACSLGTSASQICPMVDALCEIEFLEATDDGYRLTVTGREFLELDIDIEDIAVVDIVDDQYT